MEQDNDAFFDELPEELEACCQAAERRPLADITQDDPPAQPDAAQPESLQVISSLCTRLIVWTG